MKCMLLLCGMFVIAAAAPSSKKRELEGVQQASLGPPAHIVSAGLEWVSSNTGGNFVPADSFVGGHRSDNDPVYVIRALAPDGKYHPGKSGSGVNCRYAYDDDEQTTTTCDFLVVTDEDVITLEWVQTDGTSGVPNYTVQGERNEYYVCRHEYQGPTGTALLTGELDTTNGICTVVSGGSAHEFTEYEALVAIPHAPLL